MCQPRIQYIFQLFNYDVQKTHFTSGSDYKFQYIYVGFHTFEPDNRCLLKSVLNSEGMCGDGNSMAEMLDTRSTAVFIGRRLY